MRNYFLSGDKNLLTDNSLKLSIVGSRSILSYSRSVLENLFEELSNFDFCIISGGMYGVDMYSHNLALEYNLKTIFVLPQGIDDYFKSSLFNLIKFKDNSKFLFLSEYSNSFKPRKYTFLNRNKIISDLSDVLLVCQASLKSGSISTANHHFKNNKKIISIPFSLEHKQFQGTNSLISRGAEIYLNPETVLKSFSIIQKDIYKSIISIIYENPITLSCISKLLNVDEGVVEKSVLKLILEGQIYFDGEKYFV